MAAHVHLCTKVVVEAEDWEGPDLRVCANTASMCRAFETSRPRESLSFRIMRKRQRSRVIEHLSQGVHESFQDEA